MACVKTDKRKDRKKRSLGKIIIIRMSSERINVRIAKTPLTFHNIKLPLVS